MTLSPVARKELERRLRAFLEASRDDIGSGHLEAACNRYALPLVLIHDGHTRILTEAEALESHLAAVVALSRAEALPIWRQELLDIQLLDISLVCVTADVHRVDNNAHTVPPERQLLILRRTGESFRYVAIVNPIRQGYWTQDCTAEGGS